MSDFRIKFTLNGGIPSPPYDSLEVALKRAADLERGSKATIHRIVGNDGYFFLLAASHGAEIPLGKQTYCASPGLKGGQIMSAFEVFLRDNPKMASEPYGAAMAATLRRALPCGVKS